MAPQGHRKVFYGEEGGRGLIKISAIIVDRWEKNLKKHWLKRTTALPKKQNLDQNINDSKPHICNSFFENKNSTCSSGHHQFFYSRICSKKISKPIKTIEKDHSFYNTVPRKKPHSF